MILPSGVFQSINKNGIEIGDGWVSSDLPIWAPGYSQEMDQPISLSSIDLEGLRFIGEQATITIRQTHEATSIVLWSGIAKLINDPIGGSGISDLPLHNALPGRISSNAHPISAISGLAEALSVVGIRDIAAFSRGDIVWQTDPGGLWDSGLCFVQIFAAAGCKKLVHIDFEFGDVGSGSDGRWAVWGGIDATGTWNLLSQGYLPNASNGLVRYSLPNEIDINGYDLIAIAQDPGATGITQPIRQAAMYYSPNPPIGIPAVYAYLGTHIHGTPFETLPVIPAADAIFLMQKWSSIGVP